MILVFDTETTGLPLSPAAPLELQPKVIEFGGALLNPEDGSVTETINVLINPLQPLEPVITKITGLTDEDLKDKPIFSVALPEISAFCAKATHGVIAHNLPFDEALMRFELARLGMTLATEPQMGQDTFPWPEHRICTVGLFQNIWGRRPKLIELYEWSLRKPLGQTHRALDDVLALVEIVQAEGVWEEFV